jgi:protein TonB
MDLAQAMARNAGIVQRASHTDSQAPANGSAVASGVLVNIVVLSGDMPLFESVREAVGERNPVWRARTADEAADLLITGRCGVLLIDMAAVSTHADSFIVQIVEQFADVVVCVAGRRDDEPLLAPLISAGLVYRFLHKPVAARRAGMFLQAAIRRHVERCEGLVAANSLPQLVRGLGQPSAAFKWLLGTTALLALGIVVGYLASGPAPRPTTADLAAPGTQAPGAEPHVASAPRANLVLSRARAALATGRFEAPAGRNALDLFQAVLLAEPGHGEARAGLATTVEHILAQARSEEAAGNRAEASRLVQRVLAIEPELADARMLAEQLNPPVTPSRQLAEEQVAEAQRLAISDASPPATPAPVPAPVPAPRNEPRQADASSIHATSPQTVVRVMPDPLAPRYTNAAPRSKARAVSAGSQRAARTHGATGSPKPDIAGLERNPQPPASATQSVPGIADAKSAPDAALGVVAADELERVVARDPVYPARALRERTRGWVELEFTITATGTVKDIQVVAAQPDGVFERAATDALAGWKFRPRYVNGEAVAQRSVVRMRFDVDG